MTRFTVSGNSCTPLRAVNKKLQPVQEISSFGGSPGSSHGTVVDAFATLVDPRLQALTTPYCVVRTAQMIRVHCVDRRVTDDTYGIDRLVVHVALRFLHEIRTRKASRNTSPALNLLINRLWMHARRDAPPEHAPPPGQPGAPHYRCRRRRPRTTPGYRIQLLVTQDVTGSCGAGETPACCLSGRIISDTVVSC
jgi:hypothetical protein